MSYEDWKDDQIALLQYYNEFSSITKEKLYQEFKDRLLKELLGFSQHIPNHFVILQEIKDFKAKDE